MNNTKIITVLSSLLLITVTALAYNILGDNSKVITPVKEYRFVMIPVLKQSWFDIVYNASVEAGDKLGEKLGVKITIDYQVPEKFSLIEQSDLLKKAIASNPDGIAIDCIDSKSQLPLLKEAQRRGIPIVLFASHPPEGELIPHISNDFYEQGMFAGKELLKRINYKGKIAIIRGIPTNTPHTERFRAYKDLFSKYPEVEVVATAFDYDSVENAHKEAGKIIKKFPDLVGIAVSNAAGPVGAGMAIKEAGKVGEIKFIGIDDVPKLQELMREGVLDLSVATRPNNIGRWCTVTLLMENLGIEPVIRFDTKFGLLTPDMVKDGIIKGF